MFGSGRFDVLKGEAVAAGVCPDTKKGRKIMRVEFQTTGGFIAERAQRGWSRVIAPVTIDVGRLAPPERQAMERMVRNARFFELPSTVPAPRGPESRSCRIRIQDGGREHTVHVSYSVMGPKLQKLIDHLIEMEAAAMRSRRTG